MINAIIESSPALPLVLPVTPLPATERDTDSALPISPVALSSPQYFMIAAQGNEAPRVVDLMTVPVEIFNDWVTLIMACEEITDSLCRFIIKKHSETWDDLARLWLTIDFQVRGIDLRKYAYASREDAEGACNG